MVDVSSKKCEGCGLKGPSLGLPSDGKKRRWCADCAPKTAKTIKLVPSGRRTQEGGSPQKKPKATDRPNHLRHLNLCLGSGIGWRWEIPMKLRPELN